MNITTYKGCTEEEIYTLIIQVRKNYNEALEELVSVFKNKLYIKNNYNYNNELISFFYELLLKIPLDDVFSKHKLINYILSSIKKEKSKIFRNINNSSIKFCENIDINLILSNEFDLIDDFIVLRTLFSNLSTDEKKLLILYYKYGYTLKEIGIYFNGITKAAISKRKKIIIRKLQENFKI